MTTQHTSNQKRRPWSRLSVPTRLFISAMVGIGSLIPANSIASRAEEVTGFRVVGKLPVLFPPSVSQNTRNVSGWLILSRQTRRAYQFTVTGEEVGPASSTPTAEIYMQSFDLDTLQPLVRRTIKGPGGTSVYPLTRQLNNYGGANIFHAVDEQLGRIFLPVSGSFRDTDSDLAGLGTWDTTRPFQSLITIDEEKFHSDVPDDEVFVTRRGLSQRETVLLATHNLVGMQYYGQPGRGRLLLLWSDYKGGATGTVPKFHQLMQWSMDGRSSDEWVKEDLLAAACGRGLLSGGPEGRRVTMPLGILRGPNYIAMACQKSEGVTQVVQIKVDEAGNPGPTPVIDVYTLGRRYSDSIADQRGQRLLIRTQLKGTAWWVFDAENRTWAGVVATAIHDNGLLNSAGVDPESGRLYVLGPNYSYPSAQGAGLVPVGGGFGYSDAALRPAPQLQMALPYLAYPARTIIEVDPARPGKPRRLFVRRGSFDSPCIPKDELVAVPCPVEDFFMVIEDTEPIAKAAEADVVDRFTTDVKEAEGVTAANFDRSGGGYGMRVLSISGATGATSRTLDGGGALGHGSPCPPVDRELVFGEVQSSRVSNSTASSQANGVRLDQNSVTHLDSPAHQCWPTPKVGTLGNPTRGVNPPAVPCSEPIPDCDGTTIPTISSACTANERGPMASRSAPPVQEAQATCQHSLGEFDSSAMAASLSAGDVAVGFAKSRTWVERDKAHPERGPVTYVESEARQVKLGALGTIGLIRATAAAWSGGRPGTAHADFDRQICQVDFGDFQEQGCLSKEDREKWTADLNRRFVGNAEVALREPDASYKKGTPGGYQSAVQRDRLQKFVDQLITRDFSSAVPALEIIIFRDDGENGAAREVIQFAAVEASSQYGIYCLFGQASRNACNASPTDLSIDDDHGGLLDLAGPMLGDDSSSSNDEEVSSAPPLKPENKGFISRIVERIKRLPADVARLIFSSPSELLLTAGVWTLVWLPCLLGDRRRAARKALAERMQGAGA